jgi:hypothetical protein
VRNPAVMLLRFLMYQALCLMLGSVWWDTRKNIIAGIHVLVIFEMNFLFMTVWWATDIRHLHRSVLFQLQTYASYERKQNS